MSKSYNPSIQEEIANAVSHGVGVLLALVLYPILVEQALQSSMPTMVWAVSVFGFGFFMTYLASTLYHAIPNPEAKKMLRVWDHISIFFLIGGTYTPVVCRFTESDTAFLFLGTMWTLVVLGGILKVFFTGKYDWFSTIIYLFLGWMIVFLVRPLSSTMPLEIFSWLLAGGLAYTFGIIFYKWQSLKYHHAIWHLFVLAGTILQYVAIYKSLDSIV